MRLPNARTYLLLLSSLSCPLTALHDFAVIAMMGIPDSTGCLLRLGKFDEEGRNNN